MNFIDNNKNQKNHSLKWSERAWREIDPIYRSIIEMPFITELTGGTLPMEKFRFYIAQDSCYLVHFGRALALIGARAHRVDDVLAFIRYADGAIVVENALHQSYFHRYGVKDKGTEEPACHHYVHFLRSMAALEQVEVAMAAVLPCFWIYKEAGNYIFKNQKSGDNPYHQWIATYAGDEFGKLVAAAIDICDRAAEQCTGEQQEAMTRAFVASSHLEWQFWDGAYHLRRWAGLGISLTL